LQAITDCKYSHTGANKARQPAIKKNKKNLLKYLFFYFSKIDKVKIMIIYFIVSFFLKKAILYFLFRVISKLVTIPPVVRLLIELIINLLFWHWSA
jgi:hypothetical protein